MKTFQDFETAKQENRLIDFMAQAINEYRASDEYKTAVDADEYEAERNVTINRWIKYIYNFAGQKVPDFTAANHKLASNFFHRLTTQRAAYSLGNGISFSEDESIKEKLGNDFDTVLYKAAHNALCQKVSYLFWNLDHAVWFKMTEFLPLFDEHDGSLKAGFRFWSLDWNKKPVIVVMYEQNGYTKYQTKEGSSGLDLVMIEDKKGYKQQVAHNEVDPDEVVGYSNYSYLPIVPLYGNKHHQSDLIGMRGKIDAYDLINSGFANDLQECAEIYWLIGNAMGETDETLAKFRDRIKLNHIAVADTMNSSVTPYTQDIPVTAKETMLNRLHDQLYSDYGALDVHTISAGTTNDHIDAAYQPMDEEADDFEYQIIECVRGILALIGEDDVPVFNRNRISNQKERTEMVLLGANYMDDETILRKLPFITPDEVETILKRKATTDFETVNRTSENEPGEEE